VTVKIRRQFERTFIVVGLVLVGICILATVRSVVLSRTAVETFKKATKPADSLSMETKTEVDFSLWDSKRVKAYLNSLSVRTEAPMALLTVPRLKIEVPVLDKTDELSLNRGVGWIAGTTQPGATGNIGIAGHRDGFFRGLKDIEMGDTVEVATIAATQTYTVDQIEIVDPDETAVLGPRPRPSVTLVTCYPFYFIGDAPKRFVVHASLAEPGPIVSQRKPEFAK
jgi:sortase A